MNSIEILIPETHPDSEKAVICQVVTSHIPAGFPSPAEQYNTNSVAISELITHPAATFLAKAQGQSMVGVGIFDGDILVINRALEPRDGDAVVACIESEFTCKVFDRKNMQLKAEPGVDNTEKYPAFQIDQNVTIEGVVQFSLRAHRELSLG